MLTVKEVCSLYLKQFSEQVITGVLDVGDEYVVRAEGKNGDVLYTSPIAVSKQNGDFRVFFPPDNLEKLGNAKEIQLER